PDQTLPKNIIISHDGQQDTRSHRRISSYIIHSHSSLKTLKVAADAVRQRRIAPEPQSLFIRFAENPQRAPVERLIASRSITALQKLRGNSRLDEGAPCGAFRLQITEIHEISRREVQVLELIQGKGRTDSRHRFD